MRTPAIAAALLLPVLSWAQSAPAVDNRQMTREEFQNLQWRDFNRNQIKANVDGAIITMFDMQNRVIPLLGVARQKSSNEQEYIQNIAMLERDTLERTTVQKLLVSEFRERGGRLPSSYVTSQINETIQRDFGGDRSEYMRYLRRMGRTPLDERRDVEETLIVDMMRSELLRMNREVSPEKIERYYNENKAAFPQEEAVRYRQITLTPMAAETEAEVRKNAETVCQEARGGADFGELARRYSRDDFRNVGGLTDWKSVAGTNEKIVEVLRGLPDGGVTEPMDITLPGGRLILVVLQRVGYRPGGFMPIEDVRDYIEEMLLRTENSMGHEAAITRLKEKYFVRYY